MGKFIDSILTPQIAALTVSILDFHIAYHCCTVYYYKGGAITIKRLEYLSAEPFISYNYVIHIEI